MSTSYIKHIMFFDSNILLFRLPPLLIHEDQNQLAIPPSSPNGFISMAPNLLAVSSFCSSLLPLSSLFLSVNNFVNILPSNLSYFLHRVFSFHRFETYFPPFVLIFYLCLLPFLATSCLFIPPVLHFFSSTSYVNILLMSTFSLLYHSSNALLCIHVPQTQNYSSFSFQSD